VRLRLLTVVSRVLLMLASFDRFYSKKVLLVMASEASLSS
jgi:hypothetical protein